MVNGGVSAFKAERGKCMAVMCVFFSEAEPMCCLSLPVLPK